MNIQAMMKQAQSLQKDMIKTKNEIDAMEFEAESSLVKVVMSGNKILKNVTLNKENNLETDDLEMLEDMILVAVNDAIGQIDKITEQKMNKFGNIPGLM